MAKPEGVRLYALADPSDFVAEQAMIEKLALEALGIAPSGPHKVSLSPSGAWFSYDCSGELWDRPTPPILPDVKGAREAAEDCLVRLGKACSSAHPRWPARLQGMSLLPPTTLMRPAQLKLVPRPDGSAWDHWLYRAEPRLLLDSEGLTRVGVFGSQVEIRIGHGGRPVSIRSRWRPLSGERHITTASTYAAPPALDAGAGHSSANHSPAGDPQDGAPPVQYLLEGHGVPQFYLAPYYCTLHHGGVEFVSASPWSLTLHMACTRQDRRFMTVSAFARGGSGDYAYNWAMHPVARPELGVREVGPGESFILETRLGQTRASSIDLEHGAYAVLLNVKDHKTGAFKHLLQHVSSNPLEASQ